jgi:hypothetical protein
MKIELKCTTMIAGQKVPMTIIGKGKNALANKTCLEAPGEEARAAINRQHATLASLSDKINFKLNAVNLAEK